MNQNFNSLDDILKELTSLLQPLQKKTEINYNNSKYPLGFIIGNPRSGTTLFLQYLASLGCFAYPSNVLARFAYAPYLGALIQQMLFNNRFDPLGELSMDKESISFTSNLGKNKGLIAPNEFQHFFRNYIPNYFPEHINKEYFCKVDFSSLKSALVSIEAVFNKPFVTKAMMIQYNLIEFYNKIPNSIFFYVKRDPLYVMQSIFLARIQYYNDINKWWSVKPKEYTELISKDVYHQIAGQVFYTNRSIESELMKIPENKKIVVNYEDFCDNPNLFLNQIKLIYKKNNYELIVREYSKNNFQNTNKLKINEADFEKLKIAYNNFNH